MKLSDYIPRLLAFAAMNQLSHRQSRPIAEPPKPRPPGAAPDDLRKPLLIGRRGNLTRKKRKEQRCRNNR